MNYLKQLWQQFHINDQCSSQDQEKQCDKNKQDNNDAQQSGQFQVIDIQDLQLISAQLHNDNNIESLQKHCQEQKTELTEISTNESENIKNNNFSSDIFKRKQHDSEYDKQQEKLKHQIEKQEEYENIKRQKENEEKILSRLANQYMIIQLDPLQQSQKVPIKQKKSHSASTIQLDEYYIIVDSQQLNKTFETQDDWSSFYKKINRFNSLQNVSTQTKYQESIPFQNIASTGQLHHFERKLSRLSLALKELNSVLQIQPQNFHRRYQYMSKIACPQPVIKFKSTQLANKKDPKRLLQNFDKIMELVPSILYEIAQKKYKTIENIEDQLQKWRMNMIKLLTMYGANDKQIGYSKGLEYLVVGLMVTMVTSSELIKKGNQLQSQESHLQFYQDLQKYFKYLMFTKNLRNMYFPGTPKLYPEIESLTQLMSSEIPLIYQILEQLKVQYIKLFINYYKTFLLYKVKNPEVIRKIVQLLVVYGIDLVSTVLIRILVKQEKKILQMKSNEDTLLKYIAQHLIDDYFGMSESKQVGSKFKNLFVLENES